ncbi:MAG: hypothetical protein ABSF98_00495 [Bryobacteraceae bacterium]|jgi:hypothetical protein
MIGAEGRTVTPPSKLDKLRTAVGFALALILVLVILLAIWRDGLAWLSAVLGAAGGWVIGTFISPYGKEEGQQFGGFAKVVSAFFTGFVVNKVDRLSDLPATLLSDERFIRRVMVGLSCFLIAMILVFIARHYYPIEENNPMPDANRGVGGVREDPVEADPEVHKHKRR